MERNVKYLADKGLVEVDWQLGGEFAAQITAQEIDFLETGQPVGLAILNPLTVHQEISLGQRQSWRRYGGVFNGRGRSVVRHGW